MKVIVYPADRHGCGYHRLIWPTEYAAAQYGDFDITVVSPEERAVQLHMRRDNTVAGIALPEGTDVIVLQRITHAWMVQAIPLIRAQGIAVVIDVDDDLTAIHPGNPAFNALHPTRGNPQHSWTNVAAACRAATMVTTSTPQLALRYRGSAPTMVLDNYLADHYFGLPHQDHTAIGWPASLHSHPNDPEAVGWAINQMLMDDPSMTFSVLAHPGGIPLAFGITEDLESRVLGCDPIGLMDWPRAISGLGIGIAPLADTEFNRSKSWLKLLEMSAVGVPWVASPRAEYVRFHKLGAGLLADRPRDWVRQLTRLRDSATMRADQADAGRTVAAGLRLRDNAWRWVEAWSEALRAQRASV